MASIIKYLQTKIAQKVLGRDGRDRPARMAEIDSPGNMLGVQPQENLTVGPADLSCAGN